MPYGHPNKKNVPLNSNTEKLKFPLLMPLSTKPPKPLTDVNNKNSEPSKIYPSPEIN
jgi:hypothetical protein